jgi:DNA-binding NarL/FixJ family response regulator
VLSVYLVEDDPVLSAHVQGALAVSGDLRLAGHAGSLAQACATLPGLRPDVLVVDLGLPDGDGCELIRAVRAAAAAGSHWQPHILVFSVFGDEQRMMAALESGADGLCLKTADADTLLESLRVAAQGESLVTPSLARQVLRRLSAQRPGWAGPMLEVLRLAAQGYLREEIAARLQLSAHAVAALVRGAVRSLHPRERLDGPLALACRQLARAA